jgi:hypothetical protein
MTMRNSQEVSEGFPNLRLMVSRQRFYGFDEAQAELTHVLAVVDAAQDLLDAVSDEMTQFVSEWHAPEILTAYAALNALSTDDGRVDRLTRRCPDCGYTEGHTEICAGFAPAPCNHADHRPSQCRAGRGNDA